jgi:pilus assembly protein CpaC
MNKVKETKIAMNQPRKAFGLAASLLLAWSLMGTSGVIAQTQVPQRLAPAQKAIAQPPLLAGGASIDLVVPLYQSRVVTVVTPANRVSVANPDVADIVVISPTELYVLGKDLGTTNVLLWDNGNRLIGAINVEVNPLRCEPRSDRSYCPAASAMLRP